MNDEYTHPLETVSSYEDLKEMTNKFSGWSGKNCSLCKKEISNAAYSYSKKYYKKPLCGSCQACFKKK